MPRATRAAPEEQWPSPIRISNESAVHVTRPDSYEDDSQWHGWMQHTNLIRIACAMMLMFFFCSESVFYLRSLFPLHPTVHPVQRRHEETRTTGERGDTDARQDGMTLLLRGMPPSSLPRHHSERIGLTDADFFRCERAARSVCWSAAAVSSFPLTVVVGRHAPLMGDARCARTVQCARGEVGGHTQERHMSRGAAAAPPPSEP